MTKSHGVTSAGEPLYGNTRKTPQTCERHESQELYRTGPTSDTTETGPVVPAPESGPQLTPKPSWRKEGEKEKVEKTRKGL